jgi:hypothetical protein
MKLYTEEQLLKAFEDGYIFHASVGQTTKEHFEKGFRLTVYSINPISLPSDEEIDNVSLIVAFDRIEFIKGAKYVINKIQGGK